MNAPSLQESVNEVGLLALLLTSFETGRAQLPNARMETVGEDLVLVVEARAVRYWDDLLREYRDSGLISIKDSGQTVRLTRGPRLRDESAAA